jgi:hypothetical protein
MERPHRRNHYWCPHFAHNFPQLQLSPVISGNQFSLLGRILGFPLARQNSFNPVRGPTRTLTLLHEMPSPSSDWTARQPHARGWLG